MIRRHGTAALLGLAVAACGGESPRAADGPPGDRQGMVRSSDPVLRELAAELLPDLARRSGLRLQDPVRLEMRTREELVRYLRFKLDEELGPEEAEVTVASYAMLGLVPPDLDLREVLLGLYTEQVAGFYEPDSAALFVLDDQPEEALRGLLVHELVHAVQDQSADLAALTDPERGNDRTTAAQAAIEGHATLVMLEYLAEQAQGTAVDLSRLPEFGATLRPALQAMRGQFPALASAPPVIQEALLFPYLEGAGFVQDLWVREDRVAPFGAFLPASTEQILERDRSDPPVRFRLAIEGAEVLHDDDLGRLELGVMLDHYLGRGGSTAAQGWGGDRYALVEPPTGERGLLLAVAWDDEAARDRFVEWLTPMLGNFPGGATLEPLEGGPVVRGPVLLLSVGATDGVRVSLVAAEGP